MNENLIHFHLVVLYFIIRVEILLIYSSLVSKQFYQFFGRLDKYQNLNDGYTFVHPQVVNTINKTQHPLRFKNLGAFTVNPISANFKKEHYNFVVVFRFWLHINVVVAVTQGHCYTETPSSYDVINCCFIPWAHNLCFSELIVLHILVLDTLIITCLGTSGSRLLSIFKTLNLSKVPTQKPIVVKKGRSFFYWKLLFLHFISPIFLTLLLFITFYSPFHFY